MKGIFACNSDMVMNIVIKGSRSSKVQRSTKVQRGCGAKAERARCRHAFEWSEVQKINLRKENAILDNQETKKQLG